MKTRWLLLLAACLFFGAPLASAQSITRQGLAQSANGKPVPGAKIYVCTGSVTVNLLVSPPCLPQQAVYSDYLLTQPITQPVIADAFGNYVYYLPTATTVVTEVVTGIGLSGSSTVLTFPSGGGGGGTPGGTNTAVQFNNSGLFGGDAANLSYNSASHTLSVPNLQGPGASLLNLPQGASSAQDLFTLAAAPATSIANFSSPGLGVIGNFWNGTASANDSWSIIGVLGTGSNPQSELQFSHIGSSGPQTIAFESNPSAPITFNFAQSGASCPFATPTDGNSAIWWQMCVNGTDLQWEHPGSGGSGRFLVDSEVSAANFVDTALTPSTAAICANGAGGAFVNTGCAAGGGAFAGGLGTSFQDAAEIAAPANPAAGNDRLYLSNSTHQLSCLTSAGASCMPAGGGGFANPMTTLGDIIFENSTPAPARLAGSTSATMAALTQTGTGTVSASPAWSPFVGGGANPVAATLTSPTNGQSTCFDSTPKLVNCWDGVPAVVKTASYTAVQADVGSIFAFSITAAATFTAAPTANNWFAGIWNEAGSTANVTIAVQTGTITGTTTLTPGQFATLVNDGTNWYSIVASGGGSSGAFVNNISCSGTAPGCDMGVLWDSAGLPGLAVANVVSQVNSLQVTPAVTTAAPSLLPVGSDTNIGLTIGTKGTGDISIQSHGGVSILNTSSGGNVNLGSLSNNPLVIAATGSTGSVSVVTGSGSAAKGFVVKEGNAAPTLDPLSVQNSSGTELQGIGPSGIVGNPGNVILSGADYTNSTTTPSTIVSIALPATNVANTYVYDCRGIWESTNTSLVGLVLGVNISAAPTQITAGGKVVNAVSGTMATGYLSNATIGNQTVITGNAAGVTNTPYPFVLFGTIEGTPTAGATFSITGAATSGTTATVAVKRGFSCRIEANL